MKYCSLFSGIGGFDLALDRLGHECVYANDFDKYAGQIYNSRFNRKIDTRDIRLVKTDELPDFDLLVGGFPCQAFSIAGKRLGFEDTRGTLFFEIARIIKDKRPKYFLLENVKGLLNHNRGETFQTILATINELGYESEWQILNSKNHGVPQNRERIFISGYIRGEPRPEILPIRHTKSEDIIQVNKSPHFSNRIYSADGISPTLTSAMGMGGGYVPKIIGMMNYTTEKRVHDTPKEINEFLKQHKNKAVNEIADYLKLPKTQVEHYFRTDNSRAIPTPDIWEKLKKLFNFDNTWDDAINKTYTKQVEFEQTRRIYDTTISPTLTASSSDSIAIPVLTPNRLNKKQNGRRFKENGDVSFTLTSQDIQGVAIPTINPDRENIRQARRFKENGDVSYTLVCQFVNGVYDGMRIRRLTEIECERLQGFPDNWTEGISSTQRYKCLGNAVTVNVIYDICKGYNEQH